MDPKQSANKENPLNSHLAKSREIGAAVRVSWDFGFVIIILYGGAALPRFNLNEGINFRK